jgi:hypothetical protein
MSGQVIYDKPTPKAAVGGIVDPSIQYTDSPVYTNVGDKTFGSYESGYARDVFPKSLFYEAASADTPYTGLFAYYVLDNKNVLYHRSETRSALETITPSSSRNPTAANIIKEVSKLTGSGDSAKPAYMNPASLYRGQPYNVKDFIFCKHYGILPNNRMITLRRFPGPVLDSLMIPDSNVSVSVIEAGSKIQIEKGKTPNIDKIKSDNGGLNIALPIAQAVTYFGEGTGNSMSSILKFTTGLNFASERQEEMTNLNTGDPGLFSTPFGDVIKSALSNPGAAEDVDKLLGTLQDPNRQLNLLRRKLLDLETTAGGPLSKKIFVNLNTVDEMLVRKRGFSGGMETFSLVFDYNMTSTGQMNSKLLLLDLITNMLVLGSDYGTFLAPEIRLQQQEIGLGFPGGGEGYAQLITNPFEYIKQAVTGKLTENTVNRIQEFEKDIKKAADDLKRFSEDPSKGIDSNSKFMKSLSVFVSDMFLKTIYFKPMMLSGYPTGDWHLVVGNPLNPIAMIGNLVCKQVTIELDETLGPDDFPIGFKATFLMQHARQRHKGDFESNLNRGKGRMYLGSLPTSQESLGAFQDYTGKSLGQIVDEANAGNGVLTVAANNVAPDTGPVNR